MESSQLYAATLTHYSTEPLTTGPDYDPLLLLLALAGDVHPNPGPSRYPCSVCFKNVTSQGTSYLCTRCSHWVHSRCSGLRNAADYRKANGWICTACMTPPRPRTPSPPPSPAHMPTMSDKTFKINRSQLPPATARWLSCYMRGRQAKTCFRGVKSTSRKVNTGVPQGSKLSPSLFSFYIADMPRPTDPVKRVCYADDLTVWASGVHIPDLEVSLNNYLEELTTYLKDNSLLISAPKSSVAHPGHTPSQDPS